MLVYFLSLISNSEVFVATESDLVVEHHRLHHIFQSLLGQTCVRHVNRGKHREDFLESLPPGAHLRISQVLVLVPHANNGHHEALDHLFSLVGLSSFPV